MKLPLTEVGGIHGGCYVLNPPQAALPEAMHLAAFGR